MQILRTTPKAATAASKFIEPLLVVLGVGLGLAVVAASHPQSPLPKLLQQAIWAGAATASVALLVAGAHCGYRRYRRCHIEEIEPELAEAPPAEQAQPFFCLDLLKLGPSWVNAWRWKEVVRKDEAGAISVWQFKMHGGDLYLEHYHHARPLQDGQTCRDEHLWNGYQVTACYNPCCQDADIRTNAPPMPEDVLAEARQKYLDRFAENMRMMGIKRSSTYE
jgi:hypothetical protein